MPDTVAAIRAAVLAGLSLPVLAEIDRAWAAPSGYAADVGVLDRATLGRTGEALEAVPLSPIWAGEDGRGIYAPPVRGQRIVVLFVEGDRAVPVGIAAGADPRYGAAVDVRGLSVLDGEGSELRIRDRRWRLATAADSLAPVLLALIDALIAATTVGPPSPHAMSPATQAALRTVSRRLMRVLE